MYRGGTPFAKKWLRMKLNLRFKKENKFQTAAAICQSRLSNSLLIAETLLKVNALGFMFKSNSW